jgi:hypothetical protein
MLMSSYPVLRLFCSFDIACWATVVAVRFTRLKKFVAPNAAACPHAKSRRMGRASSSSLCLRDQPSRDDRYFINAAMLPTRIYVVNNDAGKRSALDASA